MRESSAIVLGRVAENHRAFVADEDDAAIVEIDLDALPEREKQSVVHSTSIGSRPRDLILLADGRLAATLPDQGAVAIFSRDAATSELHEVTRVKPAAEPMAMALDPSDATLYVSTGSSHSLIAFAINATSGALEERTRHSLGREPRAVLITSDGARAMVTHAAESFVSIVSLGEQQLGEKQQIEIRDIGNRTQCSGGGHCSGARVARGAEAIVRAGERGVVIPAAQSLPIPGQGFTKRYACPPPRRVGGKDVIFSKKVLADGQVSGYGIGTGETGPPITFDLETLDGKDGSFYGAGNPPLTGTTPSCLLPRAAVAVGDNDVLVACLGSSRIARYRGKQGDSGGAYASNYFGRPSFDFSVANKRTRDASSEGIVFNVSVEAINVPSGPTGVAVSSDKAHAIVWSSFARSVTRIDLSNANANPKAAAAPPPTPPPTPPMLTSIEVPRRTPRDEAWLAGRTLFFTNGDKRISTDGRACANCHIDGRDDGLTWNTPMGLRRTRMLAGQTATGGPFGWKGDNATLADHIKTTVKNLEGTGLPDAELSQLATFVSSIDKPAAPSSSSTTTTSSADHDAAAATNRGREVFAAAECANCHAQGASDRVVHDVGTGGGYVTPTLAGVATRQQLMHDGRFKTLDELIAGSPAMGRGAALSVDDRKALLKYLATL